MMSKDRAHRLYKEIYDKCIYWLEKFVKNGSKKVIWKLFLRKNKEVSIEQPTIIISLYQQSFFRYDSTKIMNFEKQKEGQAQYFLAAY